MPAQGLSLPTVTLKPCFQVPLRTSHVQIHTLPEASSPEFAHVDLQRLAQMKYRYVHPVFQCHNYSM
jgi:S-adenosylmethionine/arginine decarboxylase-like enzyme